MIDQCVIETVEGGFPEVNKYVHASSLGLRKRSRESQLGQEMLTLPLMEIKDGMSPIDSLPLELIKPFSHSNIMIMGETVKGEDRESSRVIFIF